MGNYLVSIMKDVPVLSVVTVLEMLSVARIIGDRTFLDGRAPDLAATINPSARGELEITDLLKLYLEEGLLSVEILGRGYAWLDTGTHASLLDAANFVRTLTERQGQQVGSPDEVAYHMGFIDRAQLLARAALFNKNDYGRYLQGFQKQ